MRLNACGVKGTLQRLVPALDAYEAEAVEGERGLEALALPTPHKHVTLVLVATDDVLKETATRVQRFGVAQYQLLTVAKEALQRNASSNDLPKVHHDCVVLTPPRDGRECRLHTGERCLLRQQRRLSCTREFVGHHNRYPAGIVKLRQLPALLLQP